MACSTDLIIVYLKDKSLSDCFFLDIGRHRSWGISLKGLMLLFFILSTQMADSFWIPLLPVMCNDFACAVQWDLRNFMVLLFLCTIFFKKVFWNMEPISHKILCQVILSRSCSSGTKLKIFLMSPQREQWKFKIKYELSNQMAANIME